MRRTVQVEIWLSAALLLLFPFDAQGRLPKGGTEVTPSLGFVTPYGGFHNGATLGWTAGIRLDYMVTDLFGVGGNVNYTRFATSSNTTRVDPLDEQRLREESTRFLIDFGLQARFYPVRIGRLSPFLETVVGASIPRTSLPAYQLPAHFSNLARDVRLGGGVDLDGRSGVAAVISVLYHSVKDPDTPAASHYWDLRFGIALPLR